MRARRVHLQTPRRPSPPSPFSLTAQFSSPDSVLRRREEGGQAELTIHHIRLTRPAELKDHGYHSPLTPPLTFALISIHTQHTQRRPRTASSQSLADVLWPRVLPLIELSSPSINSCWFTKKCQYTYSKRSLQTNKGFDKKQVNPGRDHFGAVTSERKQTFPGLDFAVMQS